VASEFPGTFGRQLIHGPRDALAVDDACGHSGIASGHMAGSMG
jgi:hypothetical protein